MYKYLFHMEILKTSYRGLTGASSEFRQTCLLVDNSSGHYYSQLFTDEPQSKASVSSHLLCRSGDPWLTFEIIFNLKFGILCAM